MKLLVEEVYCGGGIIEDSDCKKIFFSTIDVAEIYIKLNHPEWVDGLFGKEKNQSFVIYNEKNPNKVLKRIDFRY